MLAVVQPVKDGTCPTPTALSEQAFIGPNFYFIKNPERARTKA